MQIKLLPLKIVIIGAPSLHAAAAAAAAAAGVGVGVGVGAVAGGAAAGHKGESD